MHMRHTRFDVITRKAVLVCAAVALALSGSGCKKIGQAYSSVKKKLKHESPSTAETTSAPAPSVAPETATTATAVGAPAPASVGAAAPVPASQNAPATAAAVSINKNAAAICLCYHNIEDLNKPNMLTISVAEFEKEMQALKDAGFKVIGLQDYLAFRRGEKDMPAKSAIITIDDGWQSAYSNAWPILKKYDYPFTLFLYINYINTGGKSLSWDQLAEMRDAGVDIQCHTYSHADLRSPTRKGSVDKRTMTMVENDIKTLGMDGWMRKEIVESKQVLEKQLGIKVNAFAYPFGNWNAKARELVREAGYEAAFTVYGQQLRFSTPPYDQLGRYAVDAGKPQIFYTDAIQMIGGGFSGPPPSAAAQPAVAQLAAASMVTQPMDGETINNPKPTIKANLATMGDIDPNSVQMRISGLGQVPAQYDSKTKTVSYTVTQPLRDKNSYSVILNATAGGKRVETRWSFTFDSTKAGGAAPKQ